MSCDDFYAFLNLYEYQNWRTNRMEYLCPHHVPDDFWKTLFGLRNRSMNYDDLDLCNENGKYNFLKTIINVLKLIQGF